MQQYELKRYKYINNIKLKTYIHMHFLTLENILDFKLVEEDINKPELYSRSI